MTGEDLSPCMILKGLLKPVGPFDEELGAPLVEVGHFLIEAAREGVSFTECTELVSSVLRRIFKTYLDEHRLSFWGTKRHLVKELADVISGLFHTDIGDFFAQDFIGVLSTSNLREREPAVWAVANLPTVDARLLESLLDISRNSPSEGAIQMGVLRAISRMNLPPKELLGYVNEIPLRRKADVLVELFSEPESQEVVASWLSGISSGNPTQLPFMGRVLGRTAVHNPDVMRFIIQQHDELPREFLLEWQDGVESEVTRLRSGEGKEPRLSPKVLGVIKETLSDARSADFARRVFESLKVQPEELPRDMLEDFKPAHELSLKPPRLDKSEVAVRGRLEASIDAIYEMLELAESLYVLLQPVMPILLRLRDKMESYATPELLELTLLSSYGQEWKTLMNSLSFPEQVLDQFEERVLKYRGLLSQGRVKAQREDGSEAVQFHDQEIARCDRIQQEKKAYISNKVVSPYLAWELFNFADNFWSQAIDEFAELPAELLMDEAEARVEACQHLIGQFKEFLNSKAEAIGYFRFGLRGGAIFLKAATDPALRAEVLEYVQRARSILTGGPHTDNVVSSLIEAARVPAEDDSSALLFSPRLKALQSLIKLAEDDLSLAPQARPLLIDALEEIAASEGADLRLAASLFRDLGRLGIDHQSAQRIVDSSGLRVLISLCVGRHRIPLHEVRTVDSEATRLMRSILPLSVEQVEKALLHSRDAGERWRAAESLGQMSNIGNHGVIALMRTIHSNDELVNSSAAESLYKQIVESKTAFSAPELEAIGHGLKALVISRTPLSPAAVKRSGAYGYAFDTLWEINERLKRERYFSGKNTRRRSRLNLAPILELLGGWLGILGLGRLLAGRFVSGIVLLASWGSLDVLCCLWIRAIFRNQWFLCGAPFIGLIWIAGPLVSAFYLGRATYLERFCLEPLRRLTH